VQSRRSAARTSDSGPSPEAAPKTIAEAIYGRLRQDILSGEHKPGAKLRFAELTSTYEASMGTLREALTRLAAERLVTAEGQRGFRVAPISLNELWDITRLRTEMEAAALQEAIDFGNDAWEANILSCLHMLLKLEGRSAKTPLLLTEEGARLHKEFHTSLIAASPSIWRLRVIDVLYDQSERYRRLQTSHLSRMLNSAAEHQEIAAAVIARNKRVAVKLMTAHLKQTALMLEGVKSLWKPPEVGSKISTF
jgi:GntR family transcriptional regulator, carbon starvation induced regulator